MRKLLLYTFVFMLASVAVQANNIKVRNVRFVNQDVSGGINNINNHTFIQFDLSWENSWRVDFSAGVNNRDAAWVFIKYRIDEGPWQHANLAPSGHFPGNWLSLSGGPVEFEAGLLDPFAPFNPATNPCKGLFLYSSSVYTNTFNAEKIRLRWNYREQGISDNAFIELRVFAVEMVYVPEGGFFVGTGGRENGSFTDGSWLSGPTIPLRINNENSLNVGSSPGFLWGTSEIGDSTIGGVGILDASFPKGVRAFYGMKYEISQEQWVDFFNTLTNSQKATRDITGSNGKNSNGLINRNNISWTTGDAELTDTLYGDIACNFLNWADVAAYLDWSGLRPMTELEYEKACRGERTSRLNEYAWGSPAISDSVFVITQDGKFNENIVAGYFADGIAGNAHYSTTNGPSGPLRVGIFAANPATTDRGTAGATRAGLLEMSGNLYEATVSIGDNTGRGYTGIHGNGALAPTGEADVPNWPESNGTGSGWRGGAWNSPAENLRVSDRSKASLATTQRSNNHGGRGVRTHVCDVPTNLAGSVRDSIVPDFDNVRALITSGAGVGQGYQWVVPSDWTIISGEGSSILFVVVGKLPAVIRVYIVNICGAGPERTATILP
jgi:formylglycine-generating enzyme required for sulfatase activity